MAQTDALPLQRVRELLIGKFRAAMADADRYQKAIEALEHVVKVAEENDPAQLPLGFANGVERTAHGKLSEAVRLWVEDISREFTAREIVESLKKERADLNGSVRRDSVTAVLRRLEEEKVIQQHVQGRGRREGIYRRNL